MSFLPETIPSCPVKRYCLTLHNKCTIVFSARGLSLVTQKEKTLRKSGERIDWKALAAQASTLIQKEQRADYKWLKVALGGIGVGTTSILLKQLEKKDIVRRDKSRQWVPLINADGTRKDISEIPEKIRFKTKRHRGKKVAVPKAARPTHQDTSVSQEEKVDLMEKIAEHATGRSKHVLDAIVTDLVNAVSERAIVDLIKSA